MFCTNKVRAKNINAAEAKLKQGIGVCVVSIASIHNRVLTNSGILGTVLDLASDHNSEYIFLIITCI